MRYCLGRAEDGASYALRDPREADIAARVAHSGRTGSGLSDALHDLPALFPDVLRAARPWRAAVEVALKPMLEDGMTQAIAAEAERPR